MNATTNQKPDRPRNLEALLQSARRKGQACMAVAAADESFCLLATVEAAQLGIVRPILIGVGERIRRVADQTEVNIKDFEHVETDSDIAAARAAVRMVNDSDVDLLMKGSLPTKVLMRAVLNHEFGLSTGGLLSHVAAFDAPTGDRLVLLSDAGVSVNPRFAQKMEIVSNAVEAAHRLGIAEPKVAILAAIETLNLPAMPATLDAEMLHRLGEAGHFGKCVVSGPLSLDAALSSERSTHKMTSGPVAGNADVLVAPNIETGNILYKSIVCIARREAAGVVVGARVPIVVPSRADTPRTKLYSIALAALLCEEKQS